MKIYKHKLVFIFIIIDDVSHVKKIKTTTLQQIFLSSWIFTHVTKDYLMELKNEEYWSAYTGQILCPSPDIKITSKGRPKLSRIRTDIDMRKQHNQTKKNAHIVKHQDTQKEHVPTLLDCALFVINYVSFRTNYLMYHWRKY